MFEKLKECWRTVLPQIFLAHLKTLSNAWLTSRRRQGGLARCVLGCSGCDEWEHYCSECPYVWRAVSN
eukprot:7295262-Karenia_brevis.AAC.1